jgi:hypothetical protein
MDDFSSGQAVGLIHKITQACESENTLRLRKEPFTGYGCPDSMTFQGVSDLQTPVVSTT